MIVVKIGGSIQKGKQDYDLILEKIRKYQEKEDRVIVVVSAIKNATNELIEASTNHERSTEIVSNLIDRHFALLSDLAEGKAFEEGFQQLSKIADDLAKAAWSVKVLEETTPKIRDYIVSFGERMASVLMASFLKSNGLDASPVTEPPLVTDSSYGEANVLLEETKDNVTKILERVRSKLVILPGFIGRTIEGKFTTVGRGGSDYSATVIAKALGVKTVRLITEVPGIMTGDPRKFRNAKTIPRLSLEEAVELSQLGAKRLHPRTFDPLFGTDIKVIVEGLYEEGFTEVVGLCTAQDVLKGIATVDNLKLVDIESSRMVGRIGSAAAILSEAQKANVNIVAMSQPASETSIQLVVNANDAGKLVDRLGELRSLVTDVEVKDVGAVSVVGCGLQRPEVSSKVIASASGFNPLSISRGMKRVSLTFIAEKDVSDRLAQELHEVVVRWTS